MLFLRNKTCFKCSETFDLSDIIDYLSRIEDNRIHCAACLSKNYIIQNDRPFGMKLGWFLLSFGWIIGALLGFTIIEFQLSETPHKVLSAAHFVLAFIGAMIGLAIGKYGKELLLYNNGHVSDRDDY